MAEFVVNHTKKAFDRGKNVSEALQKMVKSDTDVWKPTLKISSDTYAIFKEREDNQFMMEYKVEQDEDMRNMRTYKDKTYKLYDLLWEICAKVMQKTLHKY